MTKEVIITRITPYKEKDAIVNAFSNTENITFKAVGLLKQGAKLAGQIYLGAIVEIELIPAKSGYILKGAKAVSKLHKITTNYEATIILNMIGELLSLLANVDEEVIENFLYFKKALLSLETNFPPLTTAYLVLATILNITGNGLQVNKCVRSGKSENIIAISYIDGGFVSSGYQNSDDVVLSVDELKIVRYAFLHKIEDLNRVELPNNIIKPLLSQLIDYIADSIGIKLKTKKLLFY